MPSLKLLGSLKGVSPNIANKVNLQPYLSFDYECHLIIKIEKQLKGGKSIHFFLTRSPFIHSDLEIAPPHKSRATKVLVSHLKGWRQRNALGATALDISSQ